MVTVLRSGDPTFDVAVECSIHLPTAKRSSTVTTSKGVPAVGEEVDVIMFVFEAELKSKEIAVRCPPANPSSASEDFLVVIRSVRAHMGGATAIIGSVPVTFVNVVSDCSHGTLSFASERLSVPGTDGTQVFDVLLHRAGGCIGAVSCSWHTERLSAMPGYDYTEAEGTLEFAEGQTENVIELEILQKGQTESTDTFLVLLNEAQGGVEFDKKTDGGAESSILTVDILSRCAGNGSSSARMMQFLDRSLNFDEVRTGNRAYRDQFRSAIYCGGGPEEQAEASKLDWVFHLIALPWKLVFAVCPPTSYCGGWICFVMSLVLIGLVTAFIGDLAELFGCVLDIPDSITAITFVALGTSMPDLFASQSAATQDPTADASIVNVTGSNSVNVFLGLGMPWTLGAVYWMVVDADADWSSRYPEVSKSLNGKPAFVVNSGNLGFSVLVFTFCSVMAILILYIRRRKVHGELGGPFVIKVTNSAAMVFLWLSFIVLSSWHVLRFEEAGLSEKLSVMLTVLGVASIVVAISCIMLLRYQAPPAVEEPIPTVVAVEPKVDAYISATESEDFAADHTDGPDYNDHNGISGHVHEDSDLKNDFDTTAFDGPPVQPMQTPSAPPFLAEPDLTTLSQAQLYAHSVDVWNSASDNGPIVLIPNNTRDAFLIEQHDISRSPPGRPASPGSPVSSPSPFQLRDSPSPVSKAASPSPHSLQQRL
jgi:hypothetical protein